MILLWLYRKFRARWAATRAGSTTAARGPHRRVGVSTPRRPEGGLGLVAHQLRYDLIGFGRNRQARFFTLLLPLLFLVIFVSVFGNRTVGVGHVKSSTYYVPGIAALAVVAASFVNLVISIATQRETGILKRRRSTPVPAPVLIAGSTLTATIVSLTATTVVVAVGRLAFGVSLHASAVPVAVITAVVGAVTFGCLAYALSSVITSLDAAQPTVQAIILPLYFISGVFIPDVALPRWLRDVAKAFPVEHLASGLHHAFDPALRGAGVPWGDLGVLALWAVAGLAVALRRFSWAPSAATV
jgi:ABC-2 type transport system permease protein